MARTGGSGRSGERDWFADGEAYERFMGRWSRPVARLFVERLSAPSGQRWVDVGCGAGSLTAAVLERAAPSSVIGVDASEAYLTLARQTIKSDRAGFRLGDALALPTADAQADIAVAGLVLNFIPDPPGALSEMCRVLRPGGTVAAYVWDYAGEMQMLRRFWDAAVALFPEAAERDEGRIFAICRPERLAELFGAAGLDAVETGALDVPTVFADFDDYWSPFLLAQGPAGAFCAGLAREDRERLRERLERDLPAAADGSLRLLARAWTVRGTR